MFIFDESTAELMQHWKIENSVMKNAKGNFYVGYLTTQSIYTIYVVGSKEILIINH
jgi:hypothetical protein